MHIVTRKRLSDFWKKHADAEEDLRDWIRVMRRKRYREHLEVRKDFPKTDFIGPKKAVFNICWNDYRLVVDMRYDMGKVFIRHMVTHAEYVRLINNKKL